jgi:hypothetical protein
MVNIEKKTPILPTGKTAIQVIERMMNLLDVLADSDEACSLKFLSE